MDKIILASQSPRRKQLLEAAEVDFEIVVADVDETPPENLASQKVPEFLAKKKAHAVSVVHPNALIIAADTIVLLQNKIINKPKDAADAVHILQRLQGKAHEVITGVCMLKRGKEIAFSVSTLVYFRPLKKEQILHYVERYKPFDKAGAYAIQEWIGMIGIEKIEGDYYNVMGLPVGEVVERLRESENQ